MSNTEGKNGFIVLVLVLLFMGVLSTPSTPAVVTECNDGIDNDLNGETDGFPLSGSMTFQECHRNIGTPSFPSFVYCPLWTSETVGIDAPPVPPNYAVFGC